MALMECRVELARTAIEAVDAAVATAGGVGWSLFEDVLAGRAWLIGIFAEAEEGRRRWADLRRHLPRRGLGPVQWRELADEDWRESYKAHFKAWRCGRLHWVPTWKRATHVIPRGHVAVYLDPGLAFGTGNHETTRLCCRRLAEFALQLSPRTRSRWRVIDAGCGSGILGISAAKLGCKQVFAFDNDPEAVAIARANARINRVAGVVRCVTGTLPPMLARRQADLVLANIQADVLVAHARELLAAVAPQGWLVLSGILAQEITAVRRAFRAVAGPAWVGRSHRLGEWSDLVWQRRRG